MAEEQPVESISIQGGKMNEDEIKQMSQGGVPYSPQQNDVAETRKAQPKIVVPKIRNNGEKLYKKCHTCGGCLEVSVSPAMASPLPIMPQAINGRVVNQQIIPMPQETHPDRPDRIVSDEKAADGTPLVDAHWNEDSQRIPPTPVR